MAVNPDPRPGRWILPLVILGMIAFTYFFVRELPAASPDTTLAAQPTTTTTEDTTVTTKVTETTTLDPEVQAYLDAVEQISGQLQILKTELLTINQGFDADPREIQYSEIDARMEVVVNDTRALADQVAELTPPAGLEANHEALKTAIDLAALAADDGLDGLRSTDTGERRRSALEAYVQAADDFATAVTNARNAAESGT
ncbi:MAG: hypothetical protein ACE5F5_09660 [Acidimicrobiia bacterium]